MNRRGFVALVGITSIAGCAGPLDDDAPGQLRLTVRNERPEPVSVRVVVTGDDGTVYDEESDSIARGVARSFEVEVGSTGRHEVTVSGDDWRGQLAWDAGTCARFEGTVAVTPDSVDVAGECIEQR
jgi:hypothetical protein